MEPARGGDAEVEWQLDAIDLAPVRRWLEALDAGPVTVGRGHTGTHLDVYVDTAELHLARAGYSARVRHGPRGSAEATLKSVAPNGAAADGLRRRLEITQDLGRDGHALPAAGPVGERVSALAGRRRLQPLFEVRTRRRVFPLLANGSPSGEVVLDETSVRSPAGGTLGRLRRVEVEVPEDAVAAVEPLVKSMRSACLLQPAVLSKYEVGLAASGLRPLEEASYGETAIGPGATIGEVALAVCRRHFAVMLAKEPGTRLGDDVEELHDMRVATRRLRAALALFADSLPVDAGNLRAELAWVGRTIGPVRDLDVQLEQLDGWARALPEHDREPLEALRALLLEERTRAREAMLEALDSRRYQGFVRRFGRMLRTRSGVRTPPARSVAPELVVRRYHSVKRAARRLGPDSPPSEYHRLRITAKRFRYALEFVADVYPRATKRLVARTIAVQDTLGAYQDGDVAIARLRSLAAERGADLGPATVFVMGEVAERYRQAMADAVAQVPDVYRGLEGKRWKALRKRLEADRRSAERDALDGRRRHGLR